MGSNIFLACTMGEPLTHSPNILAMARKHKNLWGDTAVLGGLGRKRDLLRLLEDKEVHGRLLHGSDFPFPAIPAVFADKIGVTKAAALQPDTNMIRQDFALKDALGVGRVSAERAYRLVCDGKQSIEKPTAGSKAREEGDGMLPAPLG